MEQHGNVSVVGTKEPAEQQIEPEWKRVDGIIVDPEERAKMVEWICSQPEKELTDIELIDRDAEDGYFGEDGMLLDD